MGTSEDEKLTLRLPADSRRRGHETQQTPVATACCQGLAVSRSRSYWGMGSSMLLLQLPQRWQRTRHFW